MLPLIAWALFDPPDSPHLQIDIYCRPSSWLSFCSWLLTLWVITAVGLFAAK